MNFNKHQNICMQILCIVLIVMYAIISIRDSTFQHIPFIIFLSFVLMMVRSIWNSKYKNQKSKHL